MTDILDYEYAVILLSQIEFDGELCEPPKPLPSVTAERPWWLEVGGAAAFFGTGHDKRVRQLFGSPPREALDESRAIVWAPRAADPNAGVAPRDDFGTGTSSGYQRYYYYEGAPSAANFRLHDWAKNHAADHIGGTMRPCQAIPDMSPYYVEFEESFGGYNFGGGNAQVDFRDFKFDWACG